MTQGTDFIAWVSQEIHNHRLQSVLTLVNLKVPFTSSFHQCTDQYNHSAPTELRNLLVTEAQLTQLDWGLGQIVWDVSSFLQDCGWVGGASCMRAHEMNVGLKDARATNKLGGRMNCEFRAFKQVCRAFRLVWIAFEKMGHWVANNWPGGLVGGRTWAVEVRVWSWRWVHWETPKVIDVRTTACDLHVKIVFLTDLITPFLEFIFTHSNYWLSSLNTLEVRLVGSGNRSLADWALAGSKYWGKLWFRVVMTHTSIVGGKENGNKLVGDVRWKIFDHFAHRPKTVERYNSCGYYLK